MPFHIHKTVKAGPFRFSFSKGGIGASVGIRGLRLGTGPRGHYVHAGAAGVYYRATLGRAGGRKRETGVKQEHRDRHSSVGAYSAVDMIDIDSGDVMQMTDERFEDVLSELNGNGAKLRLGPTLGLIVVVVGVATMFANAIAGLSILAAAVIALRFGSWVDSYRRTTVLFYDLEDETLFEAATRAFDDLSSSDGKWHVAAGGAVRDLTTWKRNAGASHIVDKKTTSLGYALPDVLKCNITPPFMQVGRQTIYFLPDVALVRDGKEFGAVAYRELNATWQRSNFIEEGRVPRDAIVIGHTWKHPNKSGGPDRRFSNNYEIPICEYEAMYLTSPSGLNELLEFSKRGVCGPFIHAVGRLATGPAGIPRAGARARSLK
ncbi:MAG: DUF4236 domain-containing protein [Hyphomicrobiales bacterium]|nr:MAG: DUF4236 domain-containing protein [Hyphomicrobiales bacterium]